MSDQQKQEYEFAVVARIQAVADHEKGTSSPTGISIDLLASEVVQ